jgi:hypothetical protein
MSRAYTGIGSRECPPEILDVMRRVAAHLARQGYTLRSGGADGADTAFEQGCASAGGDMRIYLPKPGWNGRRFGGPYTGKVDERAFEVAARLHPGWAGLKPFVRMLHARNVHQVMGDDLESPSEFVICWTPDGASERGETSSRTGGTGQAIRTAHEFGVKVHNIANQEHLEEVLSWLE